jgi:ketosteroid isomerase-like protein
MGDAEVKLFQSWADQLAAADEPLDVWYEHMWAVDVDRRAIEGAPDDVGPIIGRDALRAYVADWYEMFVDLTVVPEEFIDANDSQVVVRVHQRAVGAQSRVPIEADFWMVHTMRDAKMLRMDIYGSKAQALEAAGLAG